MKLQSTIQTRDGLTLARHTWLPDGASRAAVLLVHGYAEHAGRYDRLASFLNARDLAVYGYDMRGHGRSGGRRAFVERFDAHLDDLDAVLQSVHAEDPQRPLVLFGHSMGGAVVTLFALEHRPDVAGLALSSPALRVNNSPVLEWLAPFIGRWLPHLPTIELDRSLLSRDPAIVAEAERDLLNYHGRMPARTASELLQATQRIRARMHELELPVLLIHGTADELTDPQGSIDLYERATSKDKTLALFPELYHETFNEPEQARVRAELADWLDEHLTA